jgi:hypothetical protein
VHASHQAISEKFTGALENDLDDQLKSKVSRVRIVSLVLWKKRKAYSLGMPKNNWLMG